MKDFKKFATWCQKPNPESKSELSSHDYFIFERKRGTDDSQIHVRLIDKLNSLLAQTDNHPLSATLVDRLNFDTDVFITRESLSEKVNLTSLQIDASRFNNLLLKNLSIGGLHVSDSSDSGKLITIENCKIKSLSLRGNTKVFIRNTKIGTLRLKDANSVKFLKVVKGCILDFDCFTPGRENPFNGSVTLQKVFLPKNTRDYLLKDAQPYRNLRHYLQKIENTQMSNLIHSAEMAVERENEPFANKFVSYLYQWISDFGSSWFRPFLWFLLLTAFSCVLLYWFDGAQLRAGATHEGWHAELIGDTNVAKFKRSLYLSVQSTYNLFGLFSNRTVILPSNSWVAVLTWLQSIFSIIIITLMIFAIRRRFKIQN